MRQHLKKERICTKVILLRSQHPNKLFFLVEGVTDSRFYRKFVDGQSCHFVIGESKSSVLQAVDTLEKVKGIDAVAVVDLDYDFEEKAYNKRTNLFYTDGHDQEIMLLNSPALNSILIEYGDQEKIAIIEKQTGNIVSQLVKEAALQVGYLRWYSREEELSLRFDGLDFSAFVSSEDLSVDTTKMIQAVRENSYRPGYVSEINFSNWKAKMMQKGICPWLICCGHDAVKILLIGLKSIFGSYNARHLREAALESDLRLAYTIHNFAQTELYQNLLRWDEEKRRFLIRVGQAKEAV
ncbi:DUF4435 domain-containing protein [Heliophilum fasciatum]|uniref:Uncharacterized protein DUF4435 n=1 Tax=Heliophilum fasciatum TaxID=35700 RepID=A0A4R2RE37_9FIRM|nr:DUF4435 domain-containing protein [Heliophilum fasciatum]MCW2279012.1 hypothetical protein [Heliophilum fasciatum]TCP61752.1 uncharacterized protein DUF4435 [Heliophilum fasciatum]